MTLWRWFVGQVARLRRSIAGVHAPGPQPLHTDDHVASPDEHPGPPAHWVERVRQGAPGLLEPSLRRRGAPVEPSPAERVALPQPELEPEAQSLEEPEHGYARTEPPPAPQQSEAPVQASLIRKVRAWRLRRSLRRTPARPAPVRGPAEALPATETNLVPRKLETEPSSDGERAGSSPPEPDRRPFVSRNGRAPAPQSPAEEHFQGPPVPDKPERSQETDTPGRTARLQAPPEPDRPEPSSEQSEVVEFDAPVRPRAARVERARSPGPPPEAPRPAKSVPRAERAFDEITGELVWEQAVPLPSQDPTVAPAPAPPRRAEPLSEAGVHPWPELPPPLDQPDSEVDAALRAWEHQRRLDLEQTRL